MANNLNNSEQVEFQQDIMHVDKALVWFQDFFKDKSTTMSDMLGDICTEAVETMKQRRAEDIVTNVGDNWLAGFLDDRTMMRWTAIVNIMDGIFKFARIEDVLVET